MTFQCTESGGLLSKYGTNGGSQPYWMYSSDARKLYDGSGDLMVHDNYLYIYGPDCSINYLLDGDGNLMLADNWAETTNACPYTPVSPAPTPAPSITSLIDDTVNVNATWNASTYATGYGVEISEDNSIFNEVGSTASLAYSDSSFSRGNESFYFYRVIAYGEGGITTGSSQSIYIT